METPDRIWLIDLGDEVTWCDDPDPSGDINERDVVKYVKAETSEAREKKLVEALKKLCICGEFGFLDDLCPACKALKDNKPV